MSASPKSTLKTRERLALLYGDESFTLLPPTATVEEAQVEAEQADFGETDPAGRTRILRVTLIENEEIPRALATRSAA